MECTAQKQRINPTLIRIFNIFYAFCNQFKNLEKSPLLFFVIYLN